MSKLIDKTCCFTRHRDIPLIQYQHIFDLTKMSIERLIEKGYLYFGAGGALGFDTISANAVIKLRKLYSNIHLILVLPCLNQTRGWCEKDVEMYENIKKQADKVVYISQRYTKECMYKRNRHLVDNSSVCITYLIKNKGGTFYTVNYAKNRGLVIENIAEYL